RPARLHREKVARGRRMTTKSIAEERLLDLALEEALAGAPAASARGQKLLAAMLFLFGIGVIAALLWQRHPAAPPAPLQQPLPAPVRASGADELARLPANTVNLEARLDSGAELAGLRRFRDLRRLRILAPVAIPPGPPHAIDWPKLTERRKAARERF